MDRDTVIHRRAAVWHGRHDVRIDDRVMSATPPPGTVRIAVDWCGICGSDFLEYHSGPVVIPPPTEDHADPSIVLGHEFVGSITAVGDGLTSLSVGGRVAVDTLVRCGECSYCKSGAFNLCPHLEVLGLTLDGGLAELVDAPAYMCYLLDEHIPGDAAALVEPLAVARRAVQRAHAALLGRVMVVGCGSIGLLCLLTARQLGIADLVAVDISPSRRRAATRAGATRVLAQIPELPLADGPWALIDCTGSADVTRELVKAAPPQSRITLVGVTPGEIPIPLKEILDKELELVGSLSHDASDFETAIRLLADSSFDAEWLITKRLALEDVPSLMKACADHQEEDELKVLVTPSERHE